jgi:lipoate-protein ligase A
VESSDKNQNPFLNNSWRIISRQDFAGDINMALDHYLAENIRPGDDPVLRFYGWQPYCLSLGFHQSADDVSFEKLYQEGYTAVRRPTGGSAIFHSHELTYSLIIPKPFTDHHFIYEEFHKLLAEALKGLGYDIELHKQHSGGSYLNRGADTFACFNRPAFTEIKYQNKKLVGSAQKIYPNSLLQHGSILIGRMQNKVVRYLSGSSEYLKKYEKILEKSSTCLQEINGKEISPDEISEFIIKQFAADGRNSIYYRLPEDNELKTALAESAQFRIHYEK